MAKLEFSDKGKAPLQIDEPNSRRRLTKDEIEKGLGAEYVGEIPTTDNSFTAYALRNELVKRLRSSGGRPALAGTDVRYRVPMRGSKWRRLAEIAKAVETETFRPTVTQVASVLLDLAIDKYELGQVDVEAYAREMDLLTE